MIGDNGVGKKKIMSKIVGIEKERGEIKEFGINWRKESDLRKIREKDEYMFKEKEEKILWKKVIEDVEFGKINMGIRRKEEMEI